MSVYTDQTEADAEVIRILRNEIRRLKPMALLQLKDGTVIEVLTENYTVVTTEELQFRLEKAQGREAQLKELLGQNEPATPPEVVTPAEPQPVVTPDQPAPVQQAENYQVVEPVAEQQPEPSVPEATEELSPIVIQ